MFVMNWENDMIENPEEMTVNYHTKHYPDTELKILSALSRRDPEEISESIKKDCVAVIMQPSMLENAQVANLVKHLSNPISSKNTGKDLREFIFLSMSPFRDAKQVMNACGMHGCRDELMKIITNKQCFFVGFEKEKYQLAANPDYDDIFIIRKE